MASDLASYRPMPREAYSRAIQEYQLARGSDINNFLPGSRLNSLAEAVATICAERDLRTYNAFVASTYEDLYAGFGFERLSGTAAAGIIRLDSRDHETELQIEPFTIDVFGLQIRVLEAARIPVGATFATVEAIAAVTGTAGNIRASAIDTAAGRGTPSVSLEPGVRVWNPAAFAGGTAEESSEARHRRFQEFIKSFARSSVAGIISGARSVPGVVDAIVTTNRNPVTGAHETGWVNVYVTDGTAHPPAELIDEVRRVIEGVEGDERYTAYAAAGTEVYVGAIDTYAVHVSYYLTLVAASRLTDQEATTIANAAVMQYVNRLPIGIDPLPATIHATILKAHPDFYKVELLEPTAAPAVPANALARVGGTSGGIITGAVAGREVPS